MINQAANLLKNHIFKHVIKILIAMVFIVCLYIIACSQTYFSSLDTITCEDIGSAVKLINCDQDPYGDNDYTPTNNDRDDDDDRDLPPREKRYLKADYTVALGQVDILFVVDNSSSMNKEHQNLASQFDRFLDDLRYLEYRIGVITTDVSSSPYNPNQGRSFQDGRLIRIGGRSYIDNPKLGARPSESLIRDFQAALVRPETIACDKPKVQNAKYEYDDSNDQYWTTGIRPEKNLDEQSRKVNISCPSSDERGIFAVNQAINNPGQRNFFRRGAHLMIVIISDEDERSSSYFIDENPEFAFQNGDYPETLTEEMNRIFGPTKSFSVHSIVVDNGSCLKRQNRDRSSGAGSGRGYVGYEYMRLSEAREKELTKFNNLLRGSVISICSKDYGDQLSRVARYAGYIRVPINCSNPSHLSVRSGNRNVSLRDHTIEGKTLILPPSADVSIREPLYVSIQCEL